MLRIFCFIVFLLFSSRSFAANVTTAQELQNAIIAANGGGDSDITFSNSITIGALADLAPFLNPLCSTTAFEPVDRTITINGGGFSLSGGGTFRGLFSLAGTVTIDNLRFTNMLNQGGNGGTSGGGGAGLGGALFVADGASVTLTNCTFSSCSARGGNGGGNTNSQGGGGGMGGAGAGVTTTSYGGDGGGGFGGNGGTTTIGRGGGGGGGGAKTAGLGASSDTGATGGDNFSGMTAGNGGVGGTAGSTGVPSDNGDAPLASGQGGGGGGGQTSGTSAGPGGNGGDGSFGGGGGGGGGLAVSGASSNAGNGGAGGFGGGGGGGGDSSDTPAIGNGGNGGAGGFGGGGGGGGRGGGLGSLSGAGGNGGFGGGGGGNGPIFNSATRGTVGRGGFPTDPIMTGVQTGFGGNGGNSGNAGSFIQGPGGGGAGLGGAIFIQEGGELTIQEEAIFSSNSVTAGTGGTAGSGGTAATSGAALGADIFMMSGGTLIFDVSSPLTILPIAGNQGIISPGVPDSSTASGGLTKRGSSNLTLLGDQTYTGTTRVEEGTLLLVGSILTDVQIDSGATLTGEFSVASDRLGHGGNVTNAGTLAPGIDETGSIEIEGVYTNTATGRLIVDITPDGTVHDTIMGASSIVLQDGSTIEIVLNPGNYIKGTTYTIATAPVAGTFTNKITSGAAADDVGVVVSYGSIILTITDTVFAGGQFIFPGTPTIVLDTIEAGTLVPGSDFVTIVEILGTLGTAELNETLTAMSPVRFGAIEWINTWNNSYVASLIRKHIFDFCQAEECSPFPNLGKLWASSFGGWVGEKPVGDVGPFDTQNVGVLVGSDFYCGEGISLGAVGGYTRSFLQWKDHGGGGFLDSYYGALYGSWQDDRATVDFSFIGGATSQELARTLMFSSIDRRAKSDFWGQFFTLHGGVEGIYIIKTLECRPYATADYNYWHQNAFQEEGADSLNLNVLSKLQLFMRGEAGVRLFWQMKGDRSCFSPYLGLSWVGDFPLKDSKFRATFIDQQPIMDVTSYGRSQQMGSPQGGLQYTHCSGIRAVVGYKGFFNRDLNINDFEARLDWKF